METLNFAFVLHDCLLIGSGNPNFFVCGFKINTPVKRKRCQVLTFDINARVMQSAIMGRPLKIEYPGALYHVTSRGNERMDIFLDDWDRKKFLGILERYAGLSNQEIGKLFGGMHYSSVSKSSTRFEKEMAENRRLSTLVNGLMSKVKT